MLVSLAGEPELGFRRFRPEWRYADQIAMIVGLYIRFLPTWREWGIRLNSIDG